MPRDLKKNSTASLCKPLLCHTIFKKKKKRKKRESFPFKHRFTNIDSQKHKLRFERGHEPKKKKMNPKKILENSVHEGLSPI